MSLVTLLVASLFAAGHLYGVYRDLVRPSWPDEPVEPDLYAIERETVAEREDRGYGDLQTAKAHLLSADGLIGRLRGDTLVTLLGLGLRDREALRTEAATDVLLAEHALRTAVARMELDLDAHVPAELDGPLTLLRREALPLWLAVRLAAPAPVRGWIDVLRGHGNLADATARIADALDRVQHVLDARKPAEIRRRPLADRVPTPVQAQRVA